MKIENRLAVCVWILLIFRSFVSIAQTNGDSLYLDQPRESIYDRNPSSRWIRQLKNVIIVSPKNESAVDSFNIQSPSNIYFESEGRTITKIRIVRLKPFGASVSDFADNVTDHQKINWLGKAGNAIHISTAEFVVRNALMFHEGDKIDGFQLAYTERYLRSMSYFNDARVSVIPVSENEAEVLVVVQDVMPYSVSAGSNFSSQADLAVTNSNILGMGVELRAGAFINVEKDRLMGYEATLRLPNIGHSFISFQADYLDKYENQRWGVTLQRDFYAPATRYAGRLILEQAQTPVRYFDSTGTYKPDDLINIKYNYLDVWLGRSFQVDKNPYNNLRKNITVSLGARNMHFIDRPENAEELHYQFQNRTTYLSSFTFSRQAFYKTSLIYNFGRTEDIPYGYLLSIVSGKEINEKYNRPYLGANASSGYFIPSFGYLSGAVSYGTFFRKGMDQGMINFETNYFTPLYVIGNFKHRTFINGQYTRQLYNRLNDKLIIDDEHGIPGFRNDSVLGRQRFNLSAEHDMFTPWNFYGFRFVCYGFVHLSWLGEYDTSIILSTLYSSFGLGVRIRNNRLVFNTLQIQLAYFPNIPKNSSFRYVHFTSETVLRPRDFRPQAPEVIPLY